MKKLMKNKENEDKEVNLETNIYKVINFPKIICRSQL